jgi:Ribosomal protein S19e
VQGVVPEHFARASGGLIRHILQQLEEIGFVEKNPGSHGGRRITSQVGVWNRDRSRFDDAHCFKLGPEAIGLRLSGQRVCKVSADLSGLRLALHVVATPLTYFLTSTPMVCCRDSVTWI